MSATLLLLCALVLAEAAYVSRNGLPTNGIISKVENETLDGNGFYIHNPNRRIMVEEVDKHGNSVVRELELPDYEELQLGGRRIEQEKAKRKTDKTANGQDLYGCNNRRENQQRKCLQRQKKFLKNRYRNWKALIRRIIKDLDGKIKTIGHGTRTQTTTENLNFMSGFSPKTVMRKKE